MKYLGPTRHTRLNQAVAVVFLCAGLFVLFGLASYHAFDPSLNTASAPAKPVNLTGLLGAYFADFFLQLLGVGAYAIPTLILMLGWMWIRSADIESPGIKISGALLLVASTCCALGLIPDWRPIAGEIPAGGMIGSLLADAMVGSMNLTGAILTTMACWIVSIYLVSKFEMAHLLVWFRRPAQWIMAAAARFNAWREERARKARLRAQARALRKTLEAEKAAAKAAKAEAIAKATPAVKPSASGPPIVDPLTPKSPPRPVPLPPEIDDIPIRALDAAVSADTTPAAQPGPSSNPAPVTVSRKNEARVNEAARRERSQFQLPPTAILQEAAARSAYDTQELKETAAQIKSKFQEFNVTGNVTQINPGPVVTTFEFKPEAGVKYSRITTLTEDLCLGLQAESILIERIPGKPTVGIEVPNSKREVISLRQILESEEFGASPSPLTVALGKDINGRIKVAALDSMPHLLIAGSTGSGKSVMLNSLIMSILYKATPHQVRMIMVDPKRLEFGPYEGIPHLLTPVITDAKKATYALRNAVLEMERRLKLLASQGVRNIEQYNRKMRQLQDKPRSLFEEEDPNEEKPEPIPYILIVIDELADLMMLERANVEESVTRLAQMARAVGMHLVLATQRPSVDVITGLIKANFPSRISFRVATRVDSRTVLDVMGAEHLLGKGDMLFLPPGSSRLVRVHGSYVSEAETNDVVEFWKRQAAPDYDQSFLIPPLADDDEPEAEEGPEDAMYQEAVRVVCEIGKASTSTLQRRLRLGYGRAARILDMMQRDGIIGPPDGSRPRDVLKRPDWLEEIENQVK
ncbi:MAG TPA: DNA translocase FtsK [Bryobacteraceae bacterium]|jgi:S-DNA-T family DNA segregation ATPase FtsK/SpoIIIE